MVHAWSIFRFRSCSFFVKTTDRIRFLFFKTIIHFMFGVVIFYVAVFKARREAGQYYNVCIKIVCLIHVNQVVKKQTTDNNDQNRKKT